MTFHGGCLCGRVRYHFSALPVSSLLCHCRSCQRAASAPVVGWITIPQSAITWTGAPTFYASSPGVTRGFCPSCGSPLTWTNDPNEIDLTTASLDEPDRFPPNREVWTSHARTWAARDPTRLQYPRSTREGMLRGGGHLMNSKDLEVQGNRGSIMVRRWDPSHAKFIVLLVHGYGEHSGRYHHVADALTKEGGVVYAPDHHGHGRTKGGERAVVDDVDSMASDVARVADFAQKEHANLPIVLIGHSLGGLISTRFVQTQNVPLAALVLSGPVIGGSPGIQALAQMDPIPEVPLDPNALSRDPEVGKSYAADPLVHHGPFHRKTLNEFNAQVEKVAKGPNFGSIPTLWIHGENDPLVPYDVTKKAFDHVKGSKFEEKVYPGGMHEIFNETNKADVIGDTVSFIKRTLS